MILRLGWFCLWNGRICVDICAVGQRLGGLAGVNKAELRARWLWVIVSYSRAEWIHCHCWCDHLPLEGVILWWSCHRRQYVIQNTGFIIKTHRNLHNIMVPLEMEITNLFSPDQGFILILEDYALSFYTKFVGRIPFVMKIIASHF